MVGPIARILLRYLAAALVTYGFVTEDIGAQIAADPDLLMILGVGLAAAAEAAYALAKRRGGET